MTRVTEFRAVVFALFLPCVFICAVDNVAAAIETSCENPTQLVERARILQSEWRRESLERAITDYSEAKQCWNSTGDLRKASDAAEAIGDIRLMLSEFAKAHEAYSESLSLRNKAADTVGEARAMANVAFALIFLDRKEEARSKAEQALTLSRTAHDKKAEAQSLYTLGMSYYISGELGPALVRTNEGLLGARELNDTDLLARSLLLRGFVHNDSDDLEAALTDYQDSLTQWRAIKNRWGEARTLTSIGLAQTILGDRQSALESLQSTLPFSREMGDRMSEGAAYNNIAYVYQTLGELPIALDYYLRAWKTFEEIDFAVGKILGMEYCGDIYAMMGQLDKAMTFYQQAIEASEKTGNTLMRADTLNSLGSAYFSKGDKAKSKALFDEALAEYRKVNQWRGLSSALNNLGYFFESTGDYSNARNHYTEALTYARSAQDREGSASILFNLARIESKLGNLEESRKSIEESLSINETSRAKVASQELRVSYFASVHQHYEFYIDLLMQLHRARPTEGFDVMAFQASERARARSLLDLLAQAGTRLSQTVPRELLEKEKTLRERLNAAYLHGSQTEKSNKPPLGDDVARLKVDYEEIKHQIRMSSAEYASIALPQNVSVAELQRDLLDSETAVLEYALGDSRSFVWVLTKTALETYELPSRSVIEKEVGGLANLLASPENRKTNLGNRIGENAELWKQSAKVSKLILQPALQRTQARRLVIVGDGVLQNLPYAVLTKNDQPVPLITEYEIVSLPSASVLNVLRRQLATRQPAQLAVAVLADPVFDANDIRVHPAGRGPTGTRPSQAQEDSLKRVLRSTGFGSTVPRLLYSRQEAEAIRSFTKTKETFEALDFQASRTTALSPELAKYRTVHFATHGILNSEHPELSGILLSMVNKDGKPQEGFLQLNEIYNLNLPVELVVLSACQSALGRDFKGEGLVGLTRGFMHAGAARVVASLWKVDDAATAELMTLFYKQMLINRQRPAAALRAAQLELSKQKRYQSPYYWAGFTIQGEWK